METKTHQELAENRGKPYDKLFVIFGPPGVGKTTLIRDVLKEFPSLFALCVCHTTRTPREGEIDGEDYHFVDNETFDDMLRRRSFLVATEFDGNKYGTSFAAIKAVEETGKTCIMDLIIHEVVEIKYER